MKKRILSALLALCLLLAMAAPALAADDSRAGSTPLAAPSNLRWVDDGEWGPGEMAWDLDGAFQGELSIKIYREGTNSPVFTSRQEYEADYQGPFTSEHFITRTSLESGNYYFTIQNVGDGKIYSSSVEISSKDMPSGKGVYSYTQPANQLGETAQGRWEIGRAHV